MILSPYNAGLEILDAHGGGVHPSRRTKVAIVAFGPTWTAVQAVQTDPDWEIWGLNCGYRHPSMYHEAVIDQGAVVGYQLAIHPPQTAERNSSLTFRREFRCDRWFEIHEMRVQPADDLEWLTRCPIPVYLHELDPRVPNGVRLPIERLEAMVPGLPPTWASTFAYQVAMAMLEGFETIALYGCDFSSPREWLCERPNLLFWVGLAMGRGIEVQIPAESTLLAHPYRYGLEYDREAIWSDQRVASAVHDWLPALAPRCVERIA